MVTIGVAAQNEGVAKQTFPRAPFQIPRSATAMMPLEIIPYLIGVTYTTPLYYTSVVKCNATEVTTHTGQNNHLFLQCRCPHFKVKTRGVPLYMYCNYAILNDHLHTLQLVYVMLYVHILTSGRILLTVSVCMCSEGYCTWFVCVSVCVCLMPYFLDTVSLYVEMKVSMALVQHGETFIKGIFPINA